jgi:hypothetical protein
VLAEAKAYTPLYFQENVNTAALLSASEIVAFLIEHLSPKSMLELGAGSGIWSKIALDHGIQDVLAVDGDWVQSKNIHVPSAHFLSHNLSVPLLLPRSFDLALCLEVGEHLKKTDADVLIDSLTRHASVVVFGAAIPLQGGTLHVNEQWPAYWQEKFRNRGYSTIDVIRPVFWNNKNVAYYYKQNTFVYLKEAKEPTELGDKLRKISAGSYQQSSEYVFIHPDKYVEISTFDNVNVRLMLRKTPRLVARALSRKILRTFRHLRSSE